MATDNAIPNWARGGIIANIRQMDNTSSPSGELHFDTELIDITGSDGASITYNGTTHVWTLPVGYQYQLEHQCFPVFSGATGNLRTRWTDSSGATSLGMRFDQRPVTATNDQGQLSGSHGIVIVTGSTQTAKVAVQNVVAISSMTLDRSIASIIGWPIGND